MSLARLVFYSRNMAKGVECATLIKSMLSMCTEYSSVSGLTGGLVISESWVLHVFEGMRDQISRQLKQFYGDPRFEDITLLGLHDVDSRLFAGWAVGYAYRKMPELAQLSLKYGATSEFDPSHMSPAGVVNFVREFSHLDSIYVQRANATSLADKQPDWEVIKVLRNDTHYAQAGHKA